jgi:hypothetical protein
VRATEREREGERLGREGETEKETEKRIKKKTECKKRDVYFSCTPKRQAPGVLCTSPCSADKLTSTLIY